MNYLLANTVSGRVISTVDLVEEQPGEFLYVSNTDFVVCYQANCTPDLVFKKYWKEETQTLMDKTQMSLTYSHPHVEKDFFTQIQINGPHSTCRLAVESWDADEVDNMSQFLNSNDFDEITVPANTMITISNIPTDVDTLILVNGSQVSTSSSIQINSSINTVTVDSPKYFVKTIQIVEEM